MNWQGKKNEVLLTGYFHYFSSRLRVTMFLQGCQNLYAQMLLVLQAKCSINKKHKLLYLLQSAVMTVCKYILIGIIFVILVTLNILKGGWGASPVQNNFFGMQVHLHQLFF